MVPHAVALLSCGVRATELSETVPVPAALTALTRNLYEIPAVNPVTVADVEVETPSENVVHVEPASLEYSTM